MANLRNNPDSEENHCLTKQNEREVFALKMRKIYEDDIKREIENDFDRPPLGMENFN